MSACYNHRMGTSGNSGQPSDEKTDSREGLRQGSENDFKTARYRWVELCSLLMEQPELAALLNSNLKLLFLSRQRVMQTRALDPNFKQLYLQYDSQTCLKALSTVADLSEVKMNQYKFMFKRFSLGKAVRILINEGFFLYRNLVNKSSDPQFEFNRLIHSWVDFVFIIHNVPGTLAAPLRELILESVSLNIALRKHQIKGKPEPAAEDK